MGKLYFACDYQEGAHPQVLQRLTTYNLQSSPGYGTDEHCEAARQKIREACGKPDAAVHFLVGGTQTNATVIDALLRPWQGVVAADTGHIAVHEAGAIEAGGHKVLTLPHHGGKLAAEDLRQYLAAYWQDASHEHMVMPAMVYISQPTEFGTLYSLAELEALREVCEQYHLPLYADGARLAYALACPQNDVSLRDLARLCDVFYIGGTKCGALFGEAVVIPEPELLPGFFTLMKQHGALLAKGFLLGLQFDALFSGGLYGEIGRHAQACADRLRGVLDELGYRRCYDSPTNQVFVVLPNGILDSLGQEVDFTSWEPADAAHTVVRFATSWATTPEAIEGLHAILRRYAPAGGRP